MATILSGKEVAATLRAALRERVNALQKRGVDPTLATVRVGLDAADDSYARAIDKSCAAVGIRLNPHILPGDCGQVALETTLRELDADSGVHGILLFRPLPKGFDEAAAAACVRLEKDVDCMTPASLAGLYLGADTGFPPCTPAACMRILSHYGVDPAGRHAVVIGRSAVVGRPLATLLLRANATVTVCHSRTQALQDICRTADILIAALGRERFVTADFVKPGAVVLDVGIHWNPQEGRLTGDVDFDTVGRLAGAITPVPGGVGGVTATVLTAHVIDAAEAADSRKKTVECV